MADLEHIELFIRDDLESITDWRRRIATEHPEDTRNGEAAALLERLCKQIHSLVGTRLYADFRQATEALDDDRLADFNREASEYRKRIGFALASDPATIEDYVRDLHNLIDKDIRFIA